jgi:hypothetical protein
MIAETTPADPRYPDIETDLEFGPDFDYLTFPCPWGCLEKKGVPKKHRHGARDYPGGPVGYGGATSHCHQPGAPSWYRLIPRKTGTEE